MLPRCQFHQHKMHAFFVRNLILAAFFYLHVRSKSCRNVHLHKEFVRLTLMKLTTGSLEKKYSTTRVVKSRVIWKH